MVIGINIPIDFVSTFASKLQFELTKLAFYELHACLVFIPKKSCILWATCLSCVHSQEILHFMSYMPVLCSFPSNLAFYELQACLVFIPKKPISNFVIQIWWHELYPKWLLIITLNLFLPDSGEVLKHQHQLINHSINSSPFSPTWSHSAAQP